MTVNVSVGLIILAGCADFFIRTVKKNVIVKNNNSHKPRNLMRHSAKLMLNGKKFSHKKSRTCLRLNMIRCKRCDLEITFDDSRCLSASTGQPHDIRKCITKPGFVYCPKHQSTYPRTSACDHYLAYGWKFNHSERFVMDLILQDYQDGDWFHRRKNRKTSHDKMKENQVCKKCSFAFPKKATRFDMDAHEAECKLQTKLV